MQMVFWIKRSEASNQPGSRTSCDLSCFATTNCAAQCGKDLCEKTFAKMSYEAYQFKKQLWEISRKKTGDKQMRKISDIFYSMGVKHYFISGNLNGMFKNHRATISFISFFIAREPRLAPLLKDSHKESSSAPFLQGTCLLASMPLA